MPPSMDNPQQTADASPAATRPGTIGECAGGGSRSPLRTQVFWNGRPLRVHAARVSAFPLNRVWNGTQRPLWQTDEAAFVSFDLDAPGELAVEVAADDARSAMTLPLSFAPPMRRDENGLLRVAIDSPRHFTLLFGDTRRALHVFANPPPAWRKEGLVRRFGPGEHDVGVIVAKSGETIVVEEGAVVYGAILVANVHDARVCGRGVIDGSRLRRADHGSAAFRAAVEAGLPPSFYGAEMAVNGITVFNSERVEIEGVIVRDPPRWAVIVRGGCRDVTIENVKVVGCWRYNSDGIDICASEGVRVRDCFVRSFDDCLVARGDYLERDAPVTRDIAFERCVLWCDWGKCMEVWAVHRPCLIENVRFRDIAAVHPSGTVCDVTTWFASPDTRIRDIAFEDVEIDFAGPLWKEELDTGGTDSSLPAFSFARREEQEIAAAEVIRYGRYLGNQQFEPATDLAGFRVRYEDIAFRRFRALGEAPRLTARIDSSTPPHSISGLAIEEFPPQTRIFRYDSQKNITPHEK